MEFRESGNDGLMAGVYVLSDSLTDSPSHLAVCPPHVIPSAARNLEPVPLNASPLGSSESELVPRWIGITESREDGFPLSRE